ncbi:HIT-like protein [Ascobolus immersus RN42]|uniref:HIT-like protein n=1 Tax=Ascobolus immersus RN42 TaxID=1160509 RepID=A0A3N4ITH9_ASCIM|nr:HIT-like protein [Ascobolus immersus RN42]
MSSPTHHHQQSHPSSTPPPPPPPPSSHSITKRKRSSISPSASHESNADEEPAESSTENQSKNAFDTLMGNSSSKSANPNARKFAKAAARSKSTSSKSKSPKSPTSTSSSSTAVQTADDSPGHPSGRKVSSVRAPQLFRNALSPFIINPAKYPPSIVITSNISVTLIRDKYPKSFLHLLVLPRDLKKSVQHPFEAFKDRQFLEMVTEQAEQARILVAKELKRKFGGARWEDWVSEVKVGVHANPSMNNLHIHVISRDMCGPAMKKAGHYNSFNTPFFVPLTTFFEKDWHIMLASSKEYGNMLNGPLKCWRCGQDFGRKLVQLKAHLEVEMEKWKEDVRERSYSKPNSPKLEKDQLVMLPASMQEKPEKQLLKPPAPPMKSPPIPPKSTPPMEVIDEHDETE